MTIKSLNHQSKIVNGKSSGGIRWLAVILLVSWLLQPHISNAGQGLPCLNRITSTDTLLVADHEGQILFKKNEAKKCIPASTLKLLTALVAFRHFGAPYRFLTEFYLDSHHNLKVKGYGDPLLISEVWQEIADTLSERIQNFKYLILDDTYFSHNIRIPGRTNSTNPYDAPVGALCANFNTVFFDRDPRGKIISAEPQTPLIPFAKEKIRSLGLKKGRYTFTHDRQDAARYAGELLLYFLRERGIKSDGKIRLNTVRSEDRLIYTYRSRFTLKQALRKMIKFSNNFMANQIFIALGARAHGPPGTLAKGVRVVSGYAKKELNLAGIEIEEGSGISRENRLSALHMLSILKQFKPYRHILKKKGNELYKTGGLRGIRTRVGYIEDDPERPYYFVIFLNRSGPDMNTLMGCVKRALAGR